MSAPPLTSFQIGWICALPIEVAAAKQMLDENFGILEEQDSTDTNIYTLGRVGKHYVVIACLPLGQYGTTSATAVAINMTRTFSRSLRIGLMVGIGGGIPSVDHDIRLGDIVVSRPDGTCGGVLQYDMGKVVNCGKLLRTGSLNSPPRSLLVAAANMENDAISDDPSFPEYMKKAIQRNARTKQNFGRPDASTDRLFHIGREHPTVEATCGECPSEWEETRKERKETDPQIHYGIIASGNGVMKHGATRERLRQETGAVCFEMEAAGLMQDFPCIVIRGICDYADSHKNKQWQGYAALAAASYAKELLSYVPVGLVSQEKLSTELCYGLIAEVKEVNKSLERAIYQREYHHRDKILMALTKEQQECHQAFKTSTYEQHKNINPDRVEGTCRWMLENSQYRTWQESTHNDLLWISADPGCGKSVLAKSLVDKDLKASTSSSICYFFFKDNDEQNTLSIALCAILHQLFGINPHLLRHALPTWQRNGTKLQHEADELWRILEAVMSDTTFSNTICILDALDECRPGDRAQLVRKLENFYTQSHSSTQHQWLKFLVTSRPYDDIQEGFLPATRLFPHIHLRGEEENDQIHEEINLVVKMRVAKLVESLQLAPKTQERLEQQLFQMEHRTYLWLHLAMDDITTMFRNSLRPEEELIQLIPNSVSAAYDKILNRVPANNVADVRMILQIIVGARRALTIGEMAIALGIARSKSQHAAPHAKLNARGLDSKIRQLCGLFVFVNNSKFYLIHQTAREYLTQEAARLDRRKWFFGRADIEKLMSEVCVNYLISDDQDRDLPRNTAIIPEFLEYSAVHWPDHVRQVPSPAESTLKSRLNQLYDTTGPRVALWHPFFWKSVMKHRLRPNMDAIQLAAFNGHEHVVRSLITKNESQVNQSGKDEVSALYWASERGHANTVQILLDYGAEVNALGGEYGSPLQAASAGGHLHVVRVLLNNGAKVNVQGGECGSPLQAASLRGYINIMRLLLDEGAEVNAEGGEYGSALQAASGRGHLDIVQLLLENKAKVNTQGRGYGNALRAASHLGNLDIVRLLLDNEADANAKGGLYDSALQAASQQGHLNIVQLLLERGAKVNAQVENRRGEITPLILDNGNISDARVGGHDNIPRTAFEAGGISDGRGYGNALQAASHQGHFEIVRLLLNSGAEVNAVAGRYGSALQAASQRGHLKISRLLLDYGAEVNSQCGQYGTPLQAASSTGHLEMISFLLDWGAEVNAQGGLYGSALQAASQAGYFDIVQRLLDSGADIHSQNGFYGTALQGASYEGHTNIIQLLLDKGAKVNAQGGEYGNALQAASAGAHFDAVNLLLDNGAEVNSQGGRYGNALQAASHQGHLEIVQALVDNGAAVNLLGGQYGTALQAVSYKGHLEVMQFLLAIGADVHAEGGYFGNALQAASQGGHRKAVQVLLEKGSKVNTLGGLHGNALQAASQGGHGHIVQLLLDNGAEVNTQGGQFGSALQAASRGGYMEVVQLLLDNAAEVNVQGGIYGNSLQAASAEGHLAVVQLLLNHGAEINVQGGLYSNALRAATQRGHLEIAEILLRKGAQREGSLVRQRRLESEQAEFLRVEVFDDIIHKLANNEPDQINPQFDLN